MSTILEYYCNHEWAWRLVGASDEDDGVVLSVVVDRSDAAGPEGASFLLVLDARTMQEVARVAAPHTVNFGLHAHWFQPGLLTRC